MIRVRSGITLATAVLFALLWLCSVPATSIARFALLVGLGFYLPGRLFSSSAWDSATIVAFSLLFGMVLAAVAWAVTIATHVSPWWAAGLFVTLSGAAMIRHRGQVSSRLDGATACVCAVNVCLVAATQFGNGRTDPSNGLVFPWGGLPDAWIYAPEALFHCAISQELRHQFPMEFPAGARFPYHILYNLVSALGVEWTGASMMDVHYRLLPPLLVVSATLAAIAFARQLGFTGRAATAAGAGLFVIEDLSWIPGLAIDGPWRLRMDREWNRMFIAPFSYALHNNRPFLAGAAVALLCMALASRYLRDGDSASLWASGVLVAAAAQFKVFFALVLVAGLATTWLLVRLTRFEGESARRLLRLITVATVLFAPLALTWSSMLGSRRDPMRPFEPFPFYPALGTLTETGFFADWQDLKSAALSSPLIFGLVWVTLGVLLFTAGSLGSRGVAIFRLWRESRGGSIPALLALVSAAIGYVGCMTMVTGGVRSAIIYLWGVSLVVLTPTAGATLVSLYRDHPTRRWLVAALVLLALPTTLQTLWLGRSFAAPARLRIDTGVVEAAAVLADEARRGDVVLDPDTNESPFAALAPVRTVAGWLEFLRNALGRSDALARSRAVRDFYRGGTPDDMRRVLSAYHVRWVWIPKAVGEGQPLPELESRLENASGTLYRVRAR